MAGLTIIQMHRAIRLGLQQIDANASDGFQPEEIDVYINEVINEYVKIQFAALKREDMDLMEEGVLENIRSLIVTEEYAAIGDDSSIIPGAKVVSLPDEEAGTYYYFLHGHVKVDDELRIVKLSSFYHLRKYLITESNIPVLRQIPIILSGDNVHILRENTDQVLTDFLLSYIREPVSVDREGEVDCDLPPHTHFEITDQVIRRMTRDIMQQRMPQQSGQPEAQA